MRPPRAGGRRVYVHFGEYGTACLSSGGQVIWKTTALRFKQPYAAASSPILFGDILILTCDGTDFQFMAALDKRTGHLVWKKARGHLKTAPAKATGAPQPRQGYPKMAYSTPLVIDVDGEPQLVSPAPDHVAAYNPKTGEEIWWSGYEGFSLVARPVFGDGLVFVAGTDDQGTRHVFYAIRPNGRSEVTQTKVAWTLNRDVPHVPSPLLIGQELYLVSDRGIVTCLDATSGLVHWRERIGGNHSASPLYADGRVYCFSEEGETVILAPSKRFKLLARNRLDGRFMASPAVTGRALFLRTDTHLYRIEKKAEESRHP